MELDGELLGLLDVAFVVAEPGLPTELLALETTSARGAAYRVQDDLPHAFFPRSVQVIPDTAAALRAVLAADPRDLAVVEAGSPPAGEGSARVRTYTPNEIVLDVEATEPGLLFVSEVYYPAWRAFIDGMPADVLRTNVAFRGVVVPEGRHEVVMRYSSAEFRAGFLISGLAAAAVLAWLAIAVSRSGPRSRRAGPARDGPTA